MPETKDLLDVPKLAESPLIFISHDSRDADLAEAFSKLLKSVSAGMLKPFRSSDKKGNEGIEFGDEWYKTLMSKLDVASDVVCLLTERSLDRPWILYEAGVAKGKLGTPVHGIALGVPLSRVSAGPFYQFQNSDDNEESLAKLVLQLCRRVQGLEPDQSVVAAQVSTFKSGITETLRSFHGSKKAEKLEKAEAIDEGAVAKVLEEMKLIVRELPVRFGERLMENTERSRIRRFPPRRFHPGMIDELARMYSKRSNDPIGILIIASLLREDFPWLYEMGIEAYRSARSFTMAHSPNNALRAFRDAVEITMHGPLIHEMGLVNKDSYGMMQEFPRMINHYLEAALRGRVKREPTVSNTAESKEEIDRI